MAITCNECYDSPTSKDSYNGGGDASATTHLRVCGTSDWQVARLTAQTWVNTNRRRFFDLPLKSIEVKPIPGAEAWDITVEYALKTSDTTKVLEYKFSTTSGTAKIEKSRQTIMSRSCISGLPAYDFGGAIGVSDDGTIEGVDAKTPAFSWSQTQAFPVRQMTHAYKKLLADFTACVNAESFAGFAPGEVLFEGVSDGSLCHETSPNTGALYYYYKLTFNFSAMPNVYGIQVGDAVVDKKGWEYLWILWESVSFSGGVSKNPRNVCVEQIYPAVDFSKLGLIEL